MKKQLITMLVLFALGSWPLTGDSLASNASDNEIPPIFKEGDQIINIGLGIGSTIYRGRYYTSQVPPISVSYEMGFMDDFLVEDMTLGLGGYLGYSSAKWEYAGYGWKYNYFIIGGRAAAHYPLVENLDTYGGFMLGVKIVSSSSFGTGLPGTSPSSTGLSWSGFAGGRYYFTESLAAMAEIGYGIAYLTIGVAMKLN